MADGLWLMVDAGRDFLIHNTVSKAIGQVMKPVSLNPTLTAARIRDAGHRPFTSRIRLAIMAIPLSGSVTFLGSSSRSRTAKL